MQYITLYGFDDHAIYSESFRSPLDPTGHLKTQQVMPTCHVAMFLILVEMPEVSLKVFNKQWPVLFGVKKMKVLLMSNHKQTFPSPSLFEWAAMHIIHDHVCLRHTLLGGLNEVVTSPMRN